MRNQMRKLITLLSCVLIAGLLSACRAETAPQNTYEYEIKDVSEELAEADQLFREEKYSESLDAYLAIMRKEPKSTDARSGAVKCEIELEDYVSADRDIDLLIQLDPDNEEAYDCLKQISDITKNYYYVRKATKLALKNRVESFLKNVPPMPDFSVEGGTYGDVLTVEISCTDPDAEIHYTVVTDRRDTQEMVYRHPVRLNRGETVITAYALKDGIPSEDAEEKYRIKFDSKPVHFEDPAMERIIRAALKIPYRELTTDDMEKIISLDWYTVQSAEDYDRENPELYQLHTLSDLALMPNLETMRIQDQNTSLDFTPCEYCNFLYSIDWGRSKLPNVNAITDHVSGIQYLYISNCTMDELGDFGNCTLLSQLYLIGTGIKDISALSECKNLGYLSLQKNDLTDITPIKACEKLYSIDISENPVKDLQVLTELEVLETVRLSDYQVGDTLKELPLLTDLTIKGYDFDRAVVGDLSSLKWINISDRNYTDWRSRPLLKDLSFMEKLTNLEYAYLYNIASPDELVHLLPLVNLQELYIYNAFNEEPEKADGIIKSLHEAIPKCSIRY